MFEGERIKMAEKMWTTNEGKDTKKEILAVLKSRTTNAQKNAWCHCTLVFVSVRLS